MGDDGEEYSAGYMLPGEYPAFKIYKLSETNIYDAHPSQNVGFPQGLLAFFEIPSLDVLYDCADVLGGPSALDNCGECDDDPGNDCDMDCMDVWGGEAFIDDCGVCSGGTSGHEPNSDKDVNYDCSGNCSVEVDCVGECGGNATLDDCGVCSGGESGHTANTDDLGCGCFISGPSGCDNTCGSTSVVDCAGVCGGTDTSCSLSMDNHIAESFSINGIYPNPFNPVVNIDLSIDIAGHLQLSVLNIEGIQMNTVYNGPCSVGESTFTWRPENRASGFYFVSAAIGDQVKTQKVLFLK